MATYDPNYVPQYAYFRLGVKVLVLNQDGEFLIIQRSGKVSRAHGWDFPGGGVEKGEDPLNAAIRETIEETGLEVTSLRIISSHLTSTEDYDDLILGYTAKTNDTTVKLLGWEHESFRWVTLDELKTIILPNEHLALVNAYELLT